MVETAIASAPADEPEAAPGRASRLRASFSEAARWAFRTMRRFVREPRYRLLRRLVVAGLLVRLLLAPVTSWSIDTPSFVSATVSTFLTGSPYTDPFYNPPLGPFLQAPLLALLALIVPPAAFVPSVVSVTGLAESTSFSTVLVPIPTALLLLKLPLILADVATGVGVFTILEPRVGTRMANYSAAAWLLNPLTIWVSSVHGEYDPLAAAALILLVMALLRRWPLGAGVAIGIGTMAKLLPILCLPFVVAYFAWPADGSPRRERLRAVGTVAAGLGLAILPFLGVLRDIPLPASGGAGPTLFGGLSLFIIYNPAVVPLSGSSAGFLPASSAQPLFLAQQVVAIGTILAPPLVWFLSRRSRQGSPATAETIALPLLGAVIGGVLLDPAPQSENLVAPLALALLAAPFLGRWGWTAFGMLTVAGIGLYWALLTPVAYFYPLWIAMGPAAVAWANGIALSYSQSTGPISKGPLWLVTGLLGGVAILLLTVIAYRWALFIARPRRTAAA